MKWKKIDPDNLPKGKVLAINHVGACMKGELDHINGINYCFAIEARIDKCTHYIDPKDFEFEEENNDVVIQKYAYGIKIENGDSDSISEFSEKVRLFDSEETRDIIYNKLKEEAVNNSNNKNFIEEDSSFKFYHSGSWYDVYTKVSLKIDTKDCNYSQLRFSNYDKNN